jgi:hypothetical protein
LGRQLRGAGDGYDPASNTANGTGRTVFPDNIVSQKSLEPAAQTLQGMIPLPNTGTVKPTITCVGAVLLANMLMKIN